MVAIESDTRQRDGVTFVTATVTNTQTTPQTIVVESSVDGPIWTPESGAISVTEWHDGVWEGTVYPGQQVGIGFATSVEPSGAVVELVSATRSPDTEPAEDPDDVVDSLEDYMPSGELLRRES